MNEKRILRALFKTMLFFAFMHLIMQSVMLIVTGDLSHLNIFVISGLYQYVPGIEKGVISFIVSLGIMLAVYSLFYIRRK